MKRLTTKHLDFLTDDFGVWQHTDGSKIDKRHGYALDDVARALLVAVELRDKKKIRIYLGFLKKAITKERVVNFFGPNREPLPKAWSEDALGEAYWALCEYRSNFKDKNDGINDLLKVCESYIRKMTSIRGRAYSLIGAAKINLPLAKKLAEILFVQYQNNRKDDWCWIEDDLVYGNAIIPLSFFEAYSAFGEKKYLASGVEMLDFLNKETDLGNKPIAVGNNGWYKKGKEIALFDQQPVDPAYQVLANIRAFDLTEIDRFRIQAKYFMSWFWGNNMAKKVLINLKAQSCHDGINAKQIAPNQGAENIVCYLLAQEKIWPYLDDK